jgi:glutathione S-transferase
MVPVIVDQDAVLWESNTICRYLAGKHGRDDLLPREPLARARVEQWMDWQGGDLNNAWRYAFLSLVRHSPAHQDAAAVEASAAAWNRHMTLLERQLEQAGDFAAGATFTLADIGLGLSVNRWFMTPIARPDLPHVQAYYDRLATRAGFRQHGRNGTP